MAALRFLLSAGLLATLWLSDVVSAEQVQPPEITDFLLSIGGSTEVKTVGRSSPEARPGTDNATEILGARYYKDKLTSDPTSRMREARTAFEAECGAKGGSLEAEDSATSQEFFARVLGDLTRPTGYKHQWRGLVAICTGPDGIPWGGIAAIMQDNSGVVGGDPAVGLLNALAPLKTPTAVFAFSPRRIRPNAVVAQEVLARQQAVDQIRIDRERRVAEFRSKPLPIGTETNCGTVIEVRGPMAEIALGGAQLTPSGQSTFWSRMDRLSPPGMNVCLYGL